MTTPHPLDDLLEDLLPAATELVVSVRDRDAEVIARLLEPMDVRHLRALLIAVCVLVPDDTPFLDLLAWTHHTEPRDQDQLPYGELVTARTEKFCGGCQRVLSVREFHADRSRGDGLEHRCKGCRRDARDRRERHKEAAA